jgi:hypothetical protein
MRAWKREFAPAHLEVSAAEVQQCGLDLDVGQIPRISEIRSMRWVPVCSFAPKAAPVFNKRAAANESLRWWGFHRHVGVRGDRGGRA